MAETVSRTLELIVKAKDETKAALQTFEKRLGDIKKNVFSIKTGVISLITVFGVRSMINAANDQAAAIAGLEAVMRSMGRYTDELSQKLQDEASALQDVTNYSDDAVLAATKMLVSSKQIATDALPDVMRVMTNLAAMMGGDVTNAAMQLTRASFGMTSMFKRMGINIDENIFKVKGFAGVLEELKKKTEGQAEAARIAVGPWQALGNFINDLQEELGFLLRGVEKGMEGKKGGLLGDILGETFIQALKIAAAEVKKFRADANFNEWALNASRSVFAMVRTVALQLATLYDVSIPVFKGIWTAIRSIFHLWESLPAWMVEVGVMGAILGGKKWATALAMYSAFTGFVGDMSKVVRAMRDGIITWDEWTKMTLEQKAAFVDMINEYKDFTEEGGPIAMGKIKMPTPGEDFFAKWNSAGTAVEKVELVFDKLGSTFDEVMAKMVTAKPFEVTKFADPRTLLAAAQAAAAQAKEETNTYLAEQERLFEEGKITVDAYYADLAAKKQEMFNKDIEMLQRTIQLEQMLAAQLPEEQREESVRKVYELETQIVTLQQNQARETAKLNQDRIKAAQALQKQISQVNIGAVAGDSATAQWKKFEEERRSFSIETDEGVKTKRAELLRLYGEDAKAVEDGIYDYRLQREEVWNEKALELAKGITLKKLSAERTLSETALAAATAGGDLEAQQLEKRRQFNSETLAMEQELLSLLRGGWIEYYDFLAFQEQRRIMAERMEFEQWKEMWDERLGIANEFASGFGQLMTDLYDLSGKKSKEAAMGAKIAAIAEATIKGALAILDVMAKHAGNPWIMYPMIAIISAMTAAQIAKIGSAKMAAGGRIVGGSGTKDDVPIMAQGGEYMVRKAAVARYGVAFLEMINKGILNIPKHIGNVLPQQPAFAFAAGGMVPKLPASGGKERDVVIVNYYDQNELGRFLASARGQDALINVVSSRRETVKRVLS